MRGRKVSEGVAGPGRAAGARAGSTLIESMIALTIVVTALGGFSRAVVASVLTADQHAETSRALEAARRMLETLQGTPFVEVYARFNADASDDLVGSPGAGFAVAGLQPVDGDPDGFVGEIVFPTVGEGEELELREDLDLPTLAMPRDLNGDGAIDDQDHSDDHELLPALVRVRWRGAAGAAHVELKTLLADF